MNDQIDNWHSGLTEKQRRFCEAYSGNGGNALAAARSAGYSNPDPEGARQIGKDRIRQALESLRLTTTDNAIATRQERQELWSSMMLDDALPTMARLRASELLGKSQGDFIDRTEITGSVTVSAISTILQELDGKTPCIGG